MFVTYMYCRATNHTHAWDGARFVDDSQPAEYVTAFDNVCPDKLDYESANGVNESIWIIPGTCNNS